jgi:hypothetical protein
MRNLIFSLLLILCIPCLSFGDDIIFKNFIRDYNDNKWKIVVVEKGKIKYGDPISGKTIPLFENRDYSFTPIEMVNCPTLCFNNSKLLIAKNNYSEKNGKLILIDLKTGVERELIKTNPILSPTISRDDKYIAFLSDYNKSLYSLYILDVESGKINKIIDNCVTHGGVYDTAISWGENNQLYYSDKNKNINRLDISTNISKRITSGYDPIISPDNREIIYKKNDYKPYTPYVYELESGKTRKIGGSEIFNAIWVSNNKYYLVVRNISRIWKWNEWEKEVIIVDIETMAEHKLFQYEGYEYINIK